MKTLCLVSGLLVTLSLFGQQHYIDQEKSNLYFSATDSTLSEFNYIAIKTIVKDTLISGKKFQKIKWAKFKDIDGFKTYSTQYEHLASREYILLDSALHTIHRLKLVDTIDLQGTIFGNQGKIQSVKVLANSTSKGGYETGKNTPVKFLIADKCKRSITYNPALNVIEATHSCNETMKYCVGDVFTELTKGMENTTPLPVSLTVQPGDEVQLNYFDKGYDSTGAALYQDKQLIRFTCLGDTVVDGNKKMLLEIISYNQSFGYETSPKHEVVSISDSSYSIGEFTVPTTPFKPSFVIETPHENESKMTAEQLAEYKKEGNKKFLSFKAYVYDTLGGKPFARLVFYKSSTPYKIQVLSYFPIPYMETGNIVGKISYLKIKGIGYGKKTIPGDKVEDTYISEVKSIAKDKIEVTYYLLNQMDVTMSLASDGIDSDKIFGQKNVERGKHTVTINAPNLIKGNNYLLVLSPNQGAKLRHRFQVEY